MGNLINVYKYLNGEVKAPETVVPSGRTQSNGHKLKHRKRHLNRKVFCKSKHWHRLPVKVVESVNSGAPKKKFTRDTVLSRLLYLILF